MKQMNIKANNGVPAYDILEFSAKQNNYCICVFVINEGEKLLTQLDKMQTLSNKMDIIVVDGGSNDGSTSSKNMCSRHVNTLLTKTDVGKLGSQMRIAFAWALKRGYEGVVVVDGNNKDDTQAAVQFTQLLSEGYDHVQGSRFITGGFHANTPLSRLVGVKCLHAPVLRFFSGFHYTDTTNGFRAYSKKLLEDKHIDVFRDIFNGYELHYYLALEAAKQGYKCVETPVARVYPSSGKVPTKISPIKGSVQVLAKLFSVVLGRYRK